MEGIDSHSNRRERRSAMRAELFLNRRELRAAPPAPTDLVPTCNS